MSTKREGDALTSGRRPPAPLRVASFNVRTGLGLDGRNCWSLRAGACAAAIAGLEADLIGLQEVRRFQELGLARRLPGYAGAGAGRDDGRRRGERCTVAYRTDRLRLDAWTVRWFSDTPHVPGSRSWGNPLPRIVTLCRFTDRATGRRFGAADVHWDGASARSRLRSAEALLGWLDPALPWLVVGDLNATVADPAVNLLLDAGLRDTLPGLGARGPQAATHHAWDGSTDGTRIDHVLTDDWWEVRAARIDHARPGGRLPSDHWPVVADVVLRDG
ncbi:MAG: endonuclease/exonuclease/phosphatase family protein [Actinobacteria bacterium]|nr:endonuclease/exonuclease/phosphatase family protein [Actinomycetota bacterium]